MKQFFTVKSCKAALIKSFFHTITKRATFLSAVVLGCGIFEPANASARSRIKSEVLHSEILTATTTTLSPLPTICHGTTSATLSATISPNPEGGTIQFKVDGSNVGSPVAVSSGTASFNYDPSALAAGNHNVIAVFSGNVAFSGSSSSSVTLSINGVNPGTIVKGAVNQGPACTPLDPNQTLVPNGTTSTVATGNGTITYLWQQSTDGGTNWTSATITSPETSNTGVQFNPGPLSVTTKLRRVATSTLNTVSCTAISNVLEYPVYPLPTVASITPSGALSVCEGSSLQVSNATAGGVWSSNNTANITVSSAGLITAISAAAQSSLNLSYTVTDANGCVKAVNKTITVAAVPNITSQPSVCVGETFHLLPGTGGSWVSNNNSIASVSGAGLVTGLAVGTTKFTFTNTAAPGCSKTTPDIAVNAKPTATITSFNTEICVGNSTAIAGNVMATGNWTVTLNNGSTASGTGNGSFSINVSPTTNTTYTIASLSAANCNAISSGLTGSTIVNVKAIPTAPTISVVNNCDGTSNLTASDYTGSLLWSTMETSSSIVVITSGSYSVSQTVNNCTSNSGAIIATPKNTPIAPTISVLDHCDGTSTLTAADFTGSLLWSTNETANSITVPTAGNYSVTQTVDDCVSAPASETANPKTAPVSPTISVADHCDGTSTLTASDFTGSLLWSTNQTTNSITVSAAGNYSVTQTVDDCVSIPVSAAANPKTTPVSPTVSVVDHCDGTSTLSASNYSGILLWSTSENTATITTSNNGTYSVTQALDNCVSNSASVMANPKTTPTPPTASSPVEYCKDATANPLSASGSDLLWYETASTTVSSNIPPTPQTSVAGIQNYYVTQTINNCESNRTAIEVKIKGDCSAMPVTLAEFRVKNTEQSIRVTWKTTSEINADRFDIEKSVDPKGGFTTVASIPALENRQGGDYSYEDLKIETVSNIYYRLKMIDKDKTFAYSSIQNIKPNTISEFVLYPNPTSDYLTVKTKDWHKVDAIKIFDFGGKLIRHFTSKEVYPKIDISNLPSDKYYIKLFLRNNTVILKTFVVIR